MPNRNPCTQLANPFARFRPYTPGLPKSTTHRPVVTRNSRGSPVTTYERVPLVLPHQVKPNTARRARRAEQRRRREARQFHTLALR